MGNAPATSQKRFNEEKDKFQVNVIVQAVAIVPVCIGSKYFAGLLENKYKAGRYFYELPSGTWLLCGRYC